MAKVKVAVLEVDGVEYGFDVERLLDVADCNFVPVDDITATDAYAAIRKANAFGSYVAYAEAPAETNTSLTVATKVSITITLPVGTYCLEWMFQGYQAGVLGTGQYAVYQGATQLWLLQTNQGAYFPASGFKHVSIATAGSYTFTLQFNNAIGTATTFVKSAALRIFRVL